MHAGSASNASSELNKIGSAQSSTPSAAELEQPKRRQQVAVACENCRSRKSKCDAGRPSCSRCIEQGRTCRYDVDPNTTRSEGLKRKYAALSEDLEQLKQLYGDLHTRPEAEAHEILRRIRSDPDPFAVHKLTRDGDLLVQQHATRASGSVASRPSSIGMNARYHDHMGVRARPQKNISDHATSQAILQSMASRLEYQITVSHPHMYPQTREEIKATILPSAHDIELSCLGLAELPGTQYRTDPRGIFGPSRPSKYVDPRLWRLDTSHWSKIHVSNDWAAQAISLYLATDHAVATLIDADLFLKDLVEKRTEFCSSLLFSSLMFWASQGMSQFYENACVISYAFLQEARQLLEVEGLEDSILTAAALQYLSIGCTGTADDALAMEFLIAGKAMAERLGLMGVPNGSAQNFSASSELLSFASCTGWGIFNWMSLRSAHAHELVPQFPPNLPIPGDAESDQVDVLVFPLPPYMGKTFTVLCHFWRIVNNFALYYYCGGNTEPPLARASLTLAEETYQKLMAWTDSVVGYFRKDELSPHHVGIFHIFYHSTVIDIFRPFQDKHDLKLKSFAYRESSPQTVIEASLRQLKHLVLVFPLRYPAAAYSILWHPVCLYVANAVLTVPSPTTRHLYQNQYQQRRKFFLLCAHGYQTISSAYKLAVVILKGLLDLAVEAKIVSTAEARTILEKARESGRHWSWTDEAQTSSIKVDLQRAIADPKSADLASLVKAFDQRIQI